METPEADRIRVTSATASASSPAVQLQESPFSNFASSLSPINSVKATKYGQRFSQTQFPTPPPVFRTPRLDLHRETRNLKSNEVHRAGRDVYGDPGNRPSNLLVPCAQKDLQSCSPSGCVDDYLTDPTEVEGCTNSNDLSVDPDKKVSSLPSFATSMKVNNVSGGNSDDFMHTFQDQAEEDALRSHGFFRTATDQRVAEKFQESFELTPKERAYQDESSTCIISNVQHHEQFESQNAGTQRTWQDGSGESPKNLQNVEAYKISSGSVGPVSKGSLKESSLYQRGIRRHLQFEAAMGGKGITTCKSQSFDNVTQESDNSVLAASPSDRESLMPTNIESREVSSSREATNSSQNSALSLSFCQPEFVRSSHHDGSLPITDPFSSVFDMHFGSIAESVPMSSDIIPRKFLPGTTSPQGDQLSPEGSNHLEKESDSSLMSFLVGKIHDNTDTNQQYNQAPAGASLVITQYTDNTRTLCNSLQVTLPEQQTAPCEGVMLTLENTDRVEELNTVSPKKKRKKVPHNSESDGCKRCNCKRSRCLKLYCECFAAGVYCIDSCACESCFNTPEYEETVTDARQQIESRNPLAFAPKIINHSDSPANVVEEDHLTTPASARHKRGCNCKKSKCLKKYCECFQANVGCSDGCRCEGCSNSFGKKTVTKYQRIDRWRNQSRINSDATESLPDTTKVGTLKQFSPRWKDLPSMSHLTPRSYSYPGVEEASAPPTIGKYQNLPRPDLHHQSSFNSSAINPHWQSPVSFMPHLYENRYEHRCGSDSAVHETARQDDNMPESQKDTSTPTNASKANLPSKKLVSPPPFRSQEFRSRSSPGALQTSHKFSLQNVPSFPPLTPYSKSKDNICENESISKRDPSDNGSAELEKGLVTSAVDTASG